MMVKQILEMQMHLKVTERLINAIKAAGGPAL